MNRQTALTVVTAMFLSCSLMFGGGTALADTYLVKAGDSLYTIASNHKITVEELKQANHLQGSKIMIGQTLEIPAEYLSHRVADGESLYKLAERYGCTVRDIQKLNGLSGSTIRVGQILKIPSANTVKTDNNGTRVSSSRGGSYQRTYTQAEWDMLAKVVYGEARGEIYDGQVAVA
ncbi:MAG: LysM peptidoglycan-binding domain-containing protein, partial [Peptococcaceae bacterium]|nr:LysM peptidoglycan-binding domain-containing protein [Peptococcaceae bacterium]